MRAEGHRRLAGVVALSMLLAPPTLLLTAADSPPVPAQSSWVVEIVDGGNAGYWASLTLGSDDRPHISYTADATSLVKYATRNGMWSTEVIGSTDEGGRGTSIALDSLNRPWIAYNSQHSLGTQFDLHLAHWNGIAWETQAVEPPGVEAGWRPSLVLDSMDRPRIAYYSNIGDGEIITLAYAAWDGASWRYQTVLVTDMPRPSIPQCCISLKLDSLENPHIAYSGNDSVTYFRWDGTRWLDEFLSGGADRSHVSLALDSADLPHIAYHQWGPDDLGYARRRADGTWSFETAASSGNVGANPSLVLDAADIPHVTFSHSGVNDPTPYYLYYTEKEGPLWMQPADVVDPTEEAFGSSLALDSRQLPHVTWVRQWGPIVELRYAHVPWVDSEPPVSRALPVSPYWNGVPVRAEAADASGIASVSLWYRVSGDNATWGLWTALGTLTAPPWEWPAPYAAGEGYYEFYTTAVDAAGNAEPPPPAADAIAGYDATPPTSVALAIDPYWHAAGPIPVNATAGDTLSGLAGVTLWYAHAPDNATWSPWLPSGSLTAPPWSWLFSFPNGEGHYRFYAVAVDVAGNQEGSKTTEEAIAGYRVPPDYAPADADPPGPVTVGLSVPVTLSVSVANLGGAANATATLAFANATTPTVPFASFPLPPVAPNGSSGPFQATWVSPAVPGTYEVLALVDFADAVAESDEGNNAHAWTVTVVPGPVTTLTVGAPNHTAGGTYVTSATPLSLTVLDQSGTGIWSTRYQIGGTGWVDYAGPFSLSNEGTHFVEWYSEDNAGNIESVRSAALRVDDTPPSTTLAVGDPKHVAADTFVTSSTPLSLAAADGGATPVGLAVIEYAVDGTPWTPYVVPFALAGEGPRTLAYRSGDLLGNEETAQVITLIVDNTPPDVAIEVGTPRYASAGTYVTSATPITVTATDDGAVPVGLAAVEYRLGGAWTPYATPFTLLDPDGPKTVEARATDFLGHGAAAQIEVVVDDTPPVTTPSRGNGTYPPGTAFAFPAADAGSGLARTEVRVDGGAWTPYDAPLALAEGDHAIAFRSIDNLNNTEAERTLSVTIAGAPPPVAEPNWKPVVAAVFSALLALVGAWSARRAPWHSGVRRRIRAFALVALPFVLAEGATGIVSLLTGLLAIPPLLGVGTAVDLGILLAGIAFSAYRVRRWTPPK